MRKEINEFLAGSTEYYQSIRVASPGRQVRARLYRANEAPFLPGPAPESQGSRPSKASLPTKFQRSDSATTVGSAVSTTFSLNDIEKDSITPVSAMFAKFTLPPAAPSEAPSTLSEMSTNVDRTAETPSKKKGTAKKLFGESKRPRVTSTVRRVSSQRSAQAAVDADVRLPISKNSDGHARGMRLLPGRRRRKWPPRTGRTGNRVAGCESRNIPRSDNGLTARPCSLRQKTKIVPHTAVARPITMLARPKALLRY